MPARRTMDDAYRGGRVMPEEDQPARRRYPCFADGCPMPGTMFPDATQGTGERPGTCVWHYGVNPNDIPKVTQRLTDWQCVANEIQAGRRVLTGPLATDPGGQDDALAAAWRRLATEVELTGWSAQLQPQAGEHYGEWTRRLEYFIGARVVEVLSINQRRLS